MEQGRKVEGGAATHISRDGDLKLVFKLDKSWLEDIANHTPFDPDLKDLKISINIEAHGVKSVYTIDRQTWPTTFTHNGVEHIFDETPSIRLASITTDEVALDLRDRPYRYLEPSPWRARELIGDLDVVADQGGRPVLRGGRCPSPSPERIASGCRKRKLSTRDTAITTQKPRSSSDRPNIATKAPATYTNESIEGAQNVLPSLPAFSQVMDQEIGKALKDLAAAEAKSHLRYRGRDTVKQIPASMSSDASQPTSMSRSQSERRKLGVLTNAGETLAFMVKADTRFIRVYEGLSRLLGVNIETIRLSYMDGYGRLPSEQTIAECGLWDELGTADEETIFHVTMILEQRGGKPVIYLYPPEPMSVTVNLFLCPQWSFSALHPATPVIKDSVLGDVHGWERVGWTVDAQMDGTLLDKATGMEVSYLFWEAETTKAGLAAAKSPAESASRQGLLGGFEPAYTRLKPGQEDVVVLQSGEVSMYLDNALKVLGLHTEARTSFVTYWLPHYQRHPYIALSFVSQAEYEKAAPLDILPVPDVITRVFMLFQKVDESDLAQWAKGSERARDSVSFWRTVVGVKDKEAQQDKKVFRVLEWGGMENV